ncbi:MAG TPA: DUF305 domain-containing protein [Flavisolibacter sp.]|nr:DUF305 domain-containing protein [Flavisolibacter sp.]
MKWLIVPGLLVLVCSCESKGPAKARLTLVSKPANFNVTLPQTIDDMRARMRSISYSGNNDRDFAYITTVFNNSIIDIAKLQIATGKQTKLKAFSQSMINELKKDLTVLSNFLEHEPTTKSPDAEAFRKAMSSALNGLKVSNGYKAPDVDYLYAAVMIDCHKASTQMLRAELDYGSHQTMKIETRNMLSQWEERLKGLQLLLLKK